MKSKRISLLSLPARLSASSIVVSNNLSCVSVLLSSFCYTKTTATDRVTICHRTCSANNPWVRITIDKDAWGDTYRGSEDNGTSGCGHKREHDVRLDCNKDDYTPWAPYYKDYLIKDHGKKDEYDWYDNAYWRDWEPACPSVRNGKCCDPDKWWDRGDGVMVSFFASLLLHTNIKSFDIWF